MGGRRFRNWVRSTGRSGAVWLLACLFFARVLVPPGYMPNPEALADGRLAIEICHAGLSPALRSVWTRDRAPAGHAGQDHHHAGHGAAVSAVDLAGALADLGGPPPSGGDQHEQNADVCPFGSVVAKTFVEPASVSLPTPAPYVAAPISAPASTARVAWSVGPPLGSRAPPLNLA